MAAKFFRLHCQKISDLLESNPTPKARGSHSESNPKIRVSLINLITMIGLAPMEYSDSGIQSQCAVQAISSSASTTNRFQDIDQ